MTSHRIGISDYLIQRMLRQYMLRLHGRLGLEVNRAGHGHHSDLPVDVAIPTAGKDVELLELTIHSIRAHLRHPLANVWIIAPDSAAVRGICKKLQAQYVLETELTPVPREEIHYHYQGIDRSGWILQQLLKWQAAELVEQSHYLVHDSDTVLIRPRVFEHQGRTIFPISTDQCHPAYYHAIRQLTGMEARPWLNFTSHESLMAKERLRELQQRIEEHTGVSWPEAIVGTIKPDEVSCVSDYETYGQFMRRCHRSETRIEAWGNVELARGEIQSVEQLSRGLGDRYKSVSFHKFIT